MYAGHVDAAPNATWSNQALTGNDRITFIVTTEGWEDEPMMISLRGSGGSWQVERCTLDLLD